MPPIMFAVTGDRSFKTEANKAVQNVTLSRPTTTLDATQSTELI